MSFLPEYDSYEEGTRSTAREPERKHNKKKSKGTREVKFEIKTNGYCDDVCQDVRKFIQDTVQRGIVAVPSSITRKSYKYFEVSLKYHTLINTYKKGGDPEEINSIYKTLVRKRGHSKDVFNPYVLMSLYVFLIRRLVIESLHLVGDVNLMNSLPPDTKLHSVLKWCLLHKTRKSFCLYLGDTLSKKSLGSLSHTL